MTDIHIVDLQILEKCFSVEHNAQIYIDATIHEEAFTNNIIVETRAIHVNTLRSS